MKKPIHRSLLRSILGKIFYSSKKYLYWFLEANHFVKFKNTKSLPFRVIEHKTPLFRKLQGVDMIYQKNKVTNLKIAVPKIDGIIIRPGEKFSYWKSIGSLSKRKGYLDGIELYYGTYRPGIGGGLCQLSNLLYWLFLHTSLTVTERHRHSYDIFPDTNRKLPFGCGATCYYPFLDLEVVNNTSNTYQIRIYLDSEYLSGEIRSLNIQEESYRVYENEHSFKTEWWGGHTRHNVIVRDVFDIDKHKIQTEYVTENNAICMYVPFID